MEHIKIDDTHIVEQAAEYIINTLVTIKKQSDSHDKKIILALSGGGSPKALYPILSEKMPKDIANMLLLIQVDERIVAPSHEDSNQHLINSTMQVLLDKGAILYPMPVDSHEASTCASYEQTLQDLFSTHIPAIALLGAGEDGHTASIFPDQQDELPTDSRLVFMTPREKNGYYRMSLSEHAIYLFHTSILYVPGLKKHAIVKEILNTQNIKKYPACRIIHAHAQGIILSSK